MVRRVSAMSICLSSETQPSPPPYGPRLTFSSSSMICMARTLGAPLMVPTGKAARSASQQSSPSRITPVTVEEMCMTCE